MTTAVWIKKRAISLVVLIVALVIAAVVLTGVFWTVNGELPAILDPERAAIKTQLANFSVSTDLLFAYNSAELERDALSRLDEIADYLGDYPEYPILIAGHADSTGSSPYNMTLSEQRAAAVRDYLDVVGVENDLDSVGYGDTKPTAANSTDEGRAANRRVTFEIGG